MGTFDGVEFCVEFGMDYASFKEYLDGMKTPTADQMRLAADWLDSNDGDNGEAESCKAVAAWLNYQAHSAEVRRVAKENGLPTRWVKARVAKIMENGNGLR